MMTTRNHWTLFWLCWAAWLIATVALCRAGDISVFYSTPVLTPAQRARGVAAASLWDWLLYDDGLTGNAGTLEFVVTAGNVGGVAQTNVIHYTVNSRGQIVADGDYPITVTLNSGANPASWPPDYFAVVLFHEIGHAVGFDHAAWVLNGHMGGTLTAPDNRYVGPALLTYRAERDAAALFIPMDWGHHAEPLIGDPWYNEVMTPGISASQWQDTFLSLTTLLVIRDNGWTINPQAVGGRLLDLLPARRLRDEDNYSY